MHDKRVSLAPPLPNHPFTLRQLLRHEAGQADYSELPEYRTAVANNDPAWPASEMIQRLDSSRPRYRPGTDWRYSNLGYLLIGNLIERLTDLPLADTVNQRALTPLGLSKVRFAKTPADLQTTHLPAWIYHGLLIGPISQAALLLDLLLRGDLLPRGPAPGNAGCTEIGRPDCRASMAHRRLGPWRELSLCGHTGCGPGSVIGVYRMDNGDSSAC